MLPRTNEGEVVRMSWVTDAFKEMIPKREVKKMIEPPNAPPDIRGNQGQATEQQPSQQEVSLGEYIVNGLQELRQDHQLILERLFQTEKSVLEFVTYQRLVYEEMIRMQRLLEEQSKKK